MYVRPTTARERFTDEDIAFIVETLADNESEATSLLKLLADDEAAGAIFDSVRIARRLQQAEGLSRVSMRFFLYVTMRQTLREAGVDSPDIADYLAEMLAAFAQKQHWRTVPSGIGNTFDYEHDLQLALQNANAHQRFELHAYGGDRNLFMTGLHSAYLRRKKERRAAPDVAFYENAGRGHYRMARDHPLAGEFEMRGLFDSLALEFSRLRARLNHLANEYFN